MPNNQKITSKKSQATNNQQSANQQTTTNSQQPTTNNQQQTTNLTPIAKIAIKQIAITQADIKKFNIPTDFIKDNPALIDLIIKTESMKDEERKYWFQLLPIMTPEQIQKLQNILQNEKDQLDQLDKKYEKEIAKLNNSTAQLSAEDARKIREQNAKFEREAEKEEAKKEADILNQLDNLT
jgi:hypothetical protein